MLDTMSRGVRHLVTAVLVTVLLLVFYLSISSDPLLHLLRPTARSPSMLNVQVLEKGQEAASSPETIALLRQKYLFPPSTQPYNLMDPDNTNPSMGQAQAIDYLFKEKRNGFYIECGGLDGEVRSNTLFFERERGWKGVVIEADPANFEEMKQRHRKAYTSPTCLATTPAPSTVEFAQNSNRGHINGIDTYDEAPAMGLINVQCFPLYSYLVALNVTTVDYFSLDVEGAEYKVLTTIPWDKVDIKTLSVEYSHDAEGKEGIRKLMLSHGYVIYTEVTERNNLANDFIFVKQEMLGR